MKINAIEIRELSAVTNLVPTESLVRIFTDEGIEGNCLADTYFAEELLRRFAIEDELFPGSEVLERLPGADPVHRERIEKSWLSNYFWQPINNGVLAALDECLWDILGKKFGLPIYKLMGAYRDKVLAYASTQHYQTLDEYLEVARQCKQKGYKAIKLHPHREAEKDIALCKAFRKEVGDETILMHDPYNVYTREEAVRVGRALDDLNFYSFEDPLPTTDVDGLADLCQALDVQVLVGEHVQGLGGYTEYIRQHAADAIRCQDVNLGGITPMLKVCHLAEAFGMKCEPHSWGNPFTQASNLNVILAVRNCDFFELPYPEGIFDRGFKDVIRIDSEGYVQAPRKSGIGLDIDWDFVHKNTIRRQRFPKT